MVVNRSVLREIRVTQLTKPSVTVAFVVVAVAVVVAASSTEVVYRGLLNPPLAAIMMLV